MYSYILQWWPLSDFFAGRDPRASGYVSLLACTAATHTHTTYVCMYMRARVCVYIYINDLLMNFLQTPPVHTRPATMFQPHPGSLSARAVRHREYASILKSTQCSDIM